MGCVTGPSTTSLAPPGTPGCATFCLDAMGIGLLAMGNRFFGYTIAQKVIWYDINSLWDVSMDNPLCHGHLKGLQDATFCMNSMGTDLLAMGK